MQCYFCQRELDIFHSMDDTPYYAFCDSRRCHPFSVRYNWQNKELKSVNFSCELSNKKYCLSYYCDNTLSLYEYKFYKMGMHNKTIKIFTTHTPFELIITPDNFYKKLPLILTYS